MVLTWKILVTIISMVSLTLQMEISDPSGAGSSSGKGPSSGPSQSRFYDEESQRYYPTILNDFNIFPPPSVAHKCFAKIKLFCHSEDDYPQSVECAKKGILFYRRIPSLPLDCVDKYFYRFPLVIGNFELPETFCRGKAQECINNLQEYKDLVQAPRHEDTVILDDLQEDRDDLQEDRDDIQEHRDDLEKYLALVQDLKREEAVKSAERRSRIKIANFAFIHKDILELDAENFERKYLEHISEHVSSRNQFHNAFLFCNTYAGTRGPLTIYSDLRFEK